MHLLWNKNKEIYNKKSTSILFESTKFIIFLDFYMEILTNYLVQRWGEKGMEEKGF